MYPSCAFVFCDMSIKKWNGGLLDCVSLDGQMNYDEKKASLSDGERVYIGTGPTLRHRLHVHRNTGTLATSTVV